MDQKDMPAVGAVMNDFTRRHTMRTLNKADALRKEGKTEEALKYLMDAVGTLAGLLYGGSPDEYYPGEDY